MKVTFLALAFDASAADEHDLISVHYTTAGWAQALARKGVEVTEVKRFFRDSEFSTNGVRYVFVKDSIGPVAAGLSLPIKAIRKVVDTKPDVVHVSGFVFPFQVYILRKMLPRSVAIVVQSHGGWVLHGWRDMLNQWLNDVADGFFFTAFAQAELWFKKGVSARRSRIFEVMEGSNNFHRIASPEARAVTGISGDPVFLWIGTLDHNKDPLCVLEGFEMLLLVHPGSRLYMAYSEAALLDKVKARISVSALLRTSVVLLGKVEHSKVELLVSSADYFVLGSHYEGSGYALAEAMACGCIPVVTDIPSFRMMTGNASVGSLWVPGDATSFCNAAQKAMNKGGPVESQRVQDFFTDNLSFDAIADKAIEHYSVILERRRLLKK